MFGIGTIEILLIILLVILLFGAKKLPDFAKSFGRGIKDFKKELKEINEINN
jgi:sec-independent protein translocase protein TatA